MTIRKIFLNLILIMLPLISIQAGSVDGAAFTMQHEGVLINAQDRSEAATMIKTDSHQTGLTPRTLKNKGDADAEPAAEDPSERRVRYKPYIDGEGDRK